MKKLTEIAIIFWQDATMHDTEQRTKEEWLKKVHLIKGCAVGHILQEDKEKITLAMDMFYSEGIDFRQVLLNKEQFKKVSDAIFNKVESEEELRPNFEVGEIQIDDDKLLPIEFFEGMSSIDD